MDINIKDEIVKTDEEKTAATKNIEMMYQATEYPILHYISQITKISKNDILNENEILPQGGFPIYLNEKTYRLGVELIEVDKYTYQFPEIVNTEERNMIFPHLGMLVWFIKNMTLNLLLGNPKLSSRIKNLLQHDKMQYDEHSNTFYIEYDIHKHGSNIDILEHNKYRLGIVFTKM